MFFAKYHYGVPCELFHDIVDMIIKPLKTEELKDLPNHKCVHLRYVQLALNKFLAHGFNFFVGDFDYFFALNT